MDVYLNKWYFACKILIVVFINLIILFILFKNDNVEWTRRAFSFYNLRSPEGYEFISNIRERNVPWNDVLDSSRTTPMEQNFNRLATNDDSIRFLISNGTSVYYGNSPDLGLIII